MMEQDKVLKRLRSLCRSHRRCVFYTFKDCFLGSEALAAADEVMKESAEELLASLQEQGYFMHVSFCKRFEGSSQLYRFYNSDAWDLSSFLNVQDKLPAPLSRAEATAIVPQFQSLSKSILDTFLSNDGFAFDYMGFSSSELYQRYQECVLKLAGIDMTFLKGDEKLSFYLNLYNLMAIHGILCQPRPDSNLGRVKWFETIQYLIGGYKFSLNDIENGLIRQNSRAPYSFSLPFQQSDPRSFLMIDLFEPRIHFALVCAAKSCPSLRFYSCDNLSEVLDMSTKQFLDRHFILQESGVFESSMITNWFLRDFGGSKLKLLEFVLPYLDGERRRAADDMIHLKKPRIIFKPYNWSLNSK